MKKILVIFLFLLSISNISIAKNKTIESIIFSEEQIQYIYDNQLWPWVQKICSSSYDIENKQDIVDLAYMLHSSNLPEDLLEDALKKNLKKGMLLFIAAENALNKVARAIWRKNKIKNLREQKNEFIIDIENLGLSSYKQEKIINAYAACIAPFENAQERALFFTPKIADPMDGYSIPSKIPKIHPQKRSSEKNNKRVAYSRLKQKAINVALENNLNEKEKMLMAKCVSEKSLEFFNAKKNPSLAGVKTFKHYKNRPADSFYMHRGVCTSFVDIAYDFAQALELKVKISKNKMHTYLKANLDGQWYHIHLFNSADKDKDLIMLNELAYSNL